MKPEVSIHLIVRNGTRYLPECLAHVAAQTYPTIAFRVFDNASDDGTPELVAKLAPNAEIIRFDKNYVVGGGFNRSLAYSNSPYVVLLCVDVLMDPHFIERAVEAMEADTTRGVLQAKVLWYDKEHERKSEVIDTTGMQIFRSRRITNRGHGEKDRGQYETAEEVFCYEGAVPFFRREALESAKMRVAKTGEYEYLDEDFVWYADEVDLGWRLRLLGWSCWYDPSVRAWHDRSTTHALSGSRRGFIAQRKKIPATKRMLDFRNQRLTFLKNDFFVTLAIHSPWILKRELFLCAYFLVFERSSLRAYWDIMRMAPRMLAKRKILMGKRSMNEQEMRAWFLP